MYTHLKVIHTTRAERISLQKILWGLGFKQTPRYIWADTEKENRRVANVNTFPVFHINLITQRFATYPHSALFAQRTLELDTDTLKCYLGKGKRYSNSYLRMIKYLDQGILQPHKEWIAVWEKNILKP